MFFELITMGGLLSWIIVGVSVLLEFWFVGKEWGWPSIINPIILVSFIAFFSSFNVESYCKENWQNILWAIGIYIVVGCLWALFKWYRRCVRRGNIYSNCLEEWATKNMPDGLVITSINDIPMDKRIGFFKALKYNFERNADAAEDVWFWGVCIDDLRFSKQDSAMDIAIMEKEHVLGIQKDILKKVLSSPKENKERITVWMSAWPFSILTTLIFDFLYDFYNWLRKSLTEIFVAISRICFGKYRKDFESIKVDKE